MDRETYERLEHARHTRERMDAQRQEWEQLHLRRELREANAKVERAVGHAWPIEEG